MLINAEKKSSVPKWRWFAVQATPARNVQATPARNFFISGQSKLRFEKTIGI